MTFRPFGVTTDQFASLFPFHLACDAALNIVQVGTALGRICPAAGVGAPLGDHFEILRPTIPMDPAGLLENQHVLFVLQSRHSPLVLRAQVLPVTDPEGFVFLGSPWLRHAKDLETLGLSLTDFALHDATADLLQVVQATESALADAKALATILTQQRTELREANQALRASEARYRTISENMSDLITKVDPDNRYTYVSSSVRRVLGFEPEDLIGHAPEDFFHLEDIPRLLEVRRQRLLRPHTAQFEFRARHRDGSCRWLEAVSTPILDDRGRTIEVLVVSRDISDRKQAEAALRESESRFRSLSEQSPLGILTMGLDGQVTFANQRLVSALGATPDQVLGHAWRKLFPPGVVDAGLGELRAMKPGEEPLNVELPLLRPDGSSGWVSITGTVNVDSSNEPTGFLCVTEDISHRKEADLALARAVALEMEVSSRVQATLLHGHPPRAYPRLSVGEFAISSKGVNGDFYEFFVHSDTVVDVLLGDAMGKGLPAALQGAATKARFARSIARLLYEAGGVLPEPVDVVARVQLTLGPQFLAMETFTTLVYLRLDFSSNTLTWVDCGHPGILYQTRDGPIRSLKGDNAPLGFGETQVFSQERLTFRPGDRFVVYSDGLTETTDRDGTHYGVKRLIATVEEQASAPPDEVAFAIRTAVEDFAGPPGLDDDISCLVIGIGDEIGGPGRVSRNFPASRAALPEMRGFFSQFLQTAVPAWVPAQWRDALLLAVHEAATNIIKHGITAEAATRTVTAAIETTNEGVQVVLTYTGREFVQAASADLPDLAEFPEHGFGLALMAMGADDVVHGTDPEGHRVITLTKRFPERAGSSPT